MGEERISRGQQHLHPKGAVSHGSQILGVPFYVCIHPLSQNYQIRRGGECLVFRGSAILPPQGAGSQRSQIFGFPSIYAYTLCRRTTKFDVVTNVGRGVYLGVSHVAHPKRAEFQSSPILRFLLHILTQNDQIRHGNIWGGACFRSAAPLHLHKCVARFVSDSWVSCLLLDVQRQKHYSTIRLHFFISFTFQLESRNLCLHSRGIPAESASSHSRPAIYTLHTCPIVTLMCQLLVWAVCAPSTAARWQNLWYSAPLVDYLLNVARC